jgi:hypothetical protein
MVRFLTFIAAALASIVLTAPVAIADDDTSASSVLASAYRGDVQLSDVDYMLQAEASVNEFAAENGLVRAHWLNLSGDQFLDGCGMRRTADTSPTFCRNASVIAVGIPALAYLMKGTHYLVGAFVVAHEWGHNQQYEAQHHQIVFDKPRENGADCVGGAWLAWFAQHEHLNLGVDEINGFWKLAVKTGAQPGVEDVHGSSTERAAAMVLGYFGGLTACNFFSPTV